MTALEQEAHERVVGYWVDSVAWHAGLRDTPYRISPASGRWRIIASGDELPEWSIDRILDSEDWIVYPTGLRLPLRRVQWFWWIDGYARQGNAEQVVVFVRGDFKRALAARPEEIHGACLWEGERMVDARGLPSWCGV